MKLVRIRTAEGPVWGALEGETVVVLEGGFVGGFSRTGRRLPFREETLLAPVEPSKIVAVAANYAAHAAEMGRALPDEPRLFLKPSTAVIGPREAIRIPPLTTRVDPEGELGVVIGRRAFCVSKEEAPAVLFGFTCVNDVTCRDFQKKDGIFGRAKGFDTFCPVGPWIETDLDPRDLAIATVVDGEARASGRTTEMIFDVATLVSFISSIMTLLPGDLIATGTPPGVAPIVAGNTVEVRIEGIGALSNPVVNR